MTQQFASIELARLYESQGYLEDALTMYKILDEEVHSDGSEVLAAIHRLETALEAVPEPDREQKIARLLDKWLMLMVVQKRVRLFSAIRARL